MIPSIDADTQSALILHIRQQTRRINTGWYMYLPSSVNKPQPHQHLR